MSIAMSEHTSVFKHRWLRERVSVAADAAVSAEQCVSLEGDWDSSVADSFLPKRSLLPEHVFVLAHVLRRPVRD